MAQLFALDLACNVEITHDICKSARFHHRTHSYGPSNCMRGQYENETELLGNLQGRSRSNSLPFIRGEGQEIHENRMTARMSCHNALEEKFEKRCLRVPIAMYSFGQPRIGNHALARLYKMNVPHSFRVVSEGDIVTSTPLASCLSGISLYKHAGLEVALDEGA